MTAEYQDYLNSDKWKTKRRKVLKRANNKCERCGERVPWQIHHLTYDRIFEERLSDLQAVCGRCHMELHGIEAEKPKRKRPRLYGLKRVWARVIG